MTQAIENLLREERSFPPPPEFAADANAQPGIHDEAEQDFAGFWLRNALERVSWFKEPTVALDDSEAPFYRWFTDGTLNLSYNCLDRHLEERGDKVAYHWVGEPGDKRDISYRDLHREVCRFANALTSLGVERGDRVAIYMGMVPELPVAMLACARIGAAHSVVFGGFSSDALADRIDDGQAKVLVTQDGAWRGGNIVPLKANADVAVARTPSIEHVVVLRRVGSEVAMKEGRDLWWDEVVADQPDTFDPAELDAEDMLYILYTSGTTAKPKGIVHTQGGYLVGVAATHHYVFDLKPDDVYWCAADIGWVTGHSYIVYGPLCNGATGVIYEGAPNHPDFDRLWQIIEDYRVTILYTAPTAIRSFMKWGDQYPGKHDLSSLRLLGIGRRADQPRGVDVVPPGDRGRPLPGGRHLVADRDRDDHDHPAPRDHGHQAGVGHAALPRDRGGCGRRRRQLGAARRWRLPRARPGPGRRWRAPSTAIPIGTSRPTGRASPAAISPVMGASATTTDTSGCWGGSTTSCSYLATTSRRPRWNRRWCRIPRWPRPRSWGGRTP